MTESQREFITRNYVRFKKGWEFVGTVTSASSLLILAVHSFSPTLQYFGFSAIIVDSLYVILPLIVVFAAWFFGYIYDIKQLWEKEQKFLNTGGRNKEFDMICMQTNYIYKWLKDKEDDGK